MRRLYDEIDEFSFSDNPNVRRLLRQQDRNKVQRKAHRLAASGPGDDDDDDDLDDLDEYDDYDEDEFDTEGDDDRY